MNAASTAAGSTTPLIAPTSRLAIASLVFGLLGFLILPALAGLVCGIVALIQISRSGGALRGHGLAIAGTAVSGIMLALAPVLAVLLAITLPALAKAKEKAQTIMSLNNVRQITLAVQLYADDAGGVLPATTNWCDALLPLVGQNNLVFRRPEDRGVPQTSFSSYAYNAAVAGTKISQIDPATVLVFEAKADAWNVAGGVELARTPDRSEEAIAVGFADGHAESVTADRLPGLRWKP